MTALLFEIRDGIAWMTFNRPAALNVLNPELRRDFAAAVDRLGTANDVRCLVIRGAGKAFMAGGDIADYDQRLDGDPAALHDELTTRIRVMNRAILGLQALPFPVIASVHGAAAGAGMSLMLACDLAIAAEDTTFTLAYARIGTSPDCSGSYFLPRLVGLRKAMEIALLSERFDATAAERLGLVNRVVPAAALAVETEKLAARLAAAPTKALAATKLLLHRSLDSPLAPQLAAEAEAFADCAMSDDFAEGVRAFIQKRKPVFRGS